MQRPTLLATLALSLTLAACGGASDPRDLLSEGNKALGSGDYAAAEAHFEQAAAAIEPSNPLYPDVQKGLLRAQAGAAPQEAIATLQAKSGEMDDVLDVELYSTVAVDMCGAGHFTEAAEVIGLATERFGKTELLEKQVANITKMMQSANATDALDKLAGLGYVGDN